MLAFFMPGPMELIIIGLIVLVSVAVVGALVVALRSRKASDDNPNLNRTMTSESNTEQSFALTSDERTLFRKLSWRLWMVGLGLFLIGGVTTSVIIASERHQHFWLIAVFALLSTPPTLCAAWKATRATRSQIDARKVMFALLTDLNAALKWLSFVMFVVVLGVFAPVVMFVALRFYDQWR